MKLSVVYVVCAVCAGAASSASILDRQAAARTLNATMANLTGALLGLAQANVMVQEVEKKNHEVLDPALGDITSELHEGIGSNIFTFGLTIHRALIDVNIKVGHIAGNTSSLVSEIEAAGDTLSNLHIDNKKIDYRLKRNRVMQICADSLDRVKLVLGLIDSTKETLGINVTTPLKYLEDFINAKSTEEMDEREKIIREQDATINHWTIFFYPGTRRAAEELKSRSENIVKRIQSILARISEHGKWLKDKCEDIKKALDASRKTVSEIKGKVDNSQKTSDLYTNEFDQYLKSGDDEMLAEGSKLLVEIMLQLRDEVLKIKHNRARRWIAPPMASWLQEKPKNNCIYIYSNRTTGCIYSSTYDYLITKYESLLGSIINYQGQCNAYRMELEIFSNNAKINHLKQLRQSVSRCNVDSPKTINLLIETTQNVVNLCDEVNKVRGTSITLSAYAESFFSEANAQKRVSINIDVKLNEGLKAVVDDNLRTVEEITRKYDEYNRLIKSQLQNMRDSPCFKKEITTLDPTPSPFDLQVSSIQSRR